MNGLKVQGGPAGHNGRRVVIVTLDGKELHRDRFDTDDAHRRCKFRETVICEGRLGDDAHEFLETEILARADAEDRRATSGPIGLPVVRTMNEISSAPIEWLWEPWIPLGTLTLLDGDPGCGKSTITCDLAARVTRGWPMPPDAACKAVATPANVLLLSAEDDAARVIRPRLAAAGADLARVRTFDAVAIDDYERPVVLPGDLDTIETLVVDASAKLVVIDPLMAFLGGEVNAHKDADVRRVLHRLKIIAERTGSTVLLVRHLNKMTGGPAIYRGGGSIGISGAARSVLMVGKHPQDAGECVLASVKANLGPMPRSLMYHVESAGAVGRIRWGCETSLTADDLTAPRNGKPSAKADAASWLQDTLAAGPLAAAKVIERAEAEGIAEKTLRRAFKELGGTPRKDGFTGGWVWELPTASEDGQDGL